MDLLKKNFQKLCLLFYAFFLPVISFAQNDGKIINPLASKNIDSVPAFIKILLEGVIKVGIPVVALAIIYCGFLFVQARGNPGEIEKAKGSLMYTLIGAALLLGAWAIAGLIANTVLVL